MIVLSLRLCVRTCVVYEKLTKSRPPLVVCDLKRFGCSRSFISAVVSVDVYAGISSGNRNECGRR